MKYTRYTGKKKGLLVQGGHLPTFDTDPITVRHPFIRESETLNLHSVKYGNIQTSSNTAIYRKTTKRRNLTRVKKTQACNRDMRA